MRNDNQHMNNKRGKEKKKEKLALTVSNTLLSTLAVRYGYPNL
jgi:hypothetical protein